MLEVSRQEKSCMVGVTLKTTKRRRHEHQAHNDLPSPGQKEPRHGIYVKIATAQHIIPKHPPHRRKVQIPRLTQTLTLAHNPMLFTNTISTIATSQYDRVQYPDDLDYSCIQFKGGEVSRTLASAES